MLFNSKHGPQNSEIGKPFKPFKPLVVALARMIVLVSMAQAHGPIRGGYPRQFMPENPSGIWTREPDFTAKVIGRNYNTGQSSLFADTFSQADGAPANWTATRGTFGVVSNVLRTTSTSTTYLRPTTDYTAWDDYRITLRLQRQASAGSSSYGLIYFRSVLSGSNDTGYALLVRNNGNMDLYTRAAGASLS